LLSSLDFEQLVLLAGNSIKSSKSLGRNIFAMESDIALFRAVLDPMNTNNARHLASKVTVASATVADKHPAQKPKPMAAKKRPRPCSDSE
jgi:hypothetical protein